MQSLRYALVAYVRNPVGQFVEGLRREMHPEMAHLAAHVTILPPRCLGGTEQQAIEALNEICKTVAPFEIDLGDVETFIPVTPTVYIRVGQAAYRMRELHDLLSSHAALRGEEDWPYTPHMTIIKMAGEPQAQAALGVARDRWQQFPGARRVRIEELTFVREDRDHCWVDLSSVTLGSEQAVGRR